MLRWESPVWGVIGGPGGAPWGVSSSCPWALAGHLLATFPTRTLHHRVINDDAGGVDCRQYISTASRRVLEAQIKGESGDFFPIVLEAGDLIAFEISACPQHIKAEHQRTCCTSTHFGTNLNPQFRRARCISSHNSPLPPSQWRPHRFGADHRGQKTLDTHTSASNSLRNFWRPV